MNGGVNARWVAAVDGSLESLELKIKLIHSYIESQVYRKCLSSVVLVFWAITPL